MLKGLNECIYVSIENYVRYIIDGQSVLTIITTLFSYYMTLSKLLQ